MPRLFALVLWLSSAPLVAQAQAAAEPLGEAPSAEAPGGQAGGEPRHGEPRHGAREADVSELPVEHPGVLAFRIVAGTSRAFPSNGWLFGFGSQLEVDLGGVLELAVGAGVLLGERSTVFPVDVLLKKTLRVGERVGFFAGLGPTMAVVADGEQADVAFGGTANAGFVLWLEARFGILIEATYQLLIEGEPVHDIEGAVGVAWGL